MLRGADNLGALYQIIEAKSGGVLDIRMIVQNFNLGPVGSNRPNADDFAHNAGLIDPYEITEFH